jgi:hypothetical protein
VQLAWARSAAPSSSPPHCDHRGVRPDRRGHPVADRHGPGRRGFRHRRAADRRTLLGFAGLKVATFTRLPLLGARAERVGRRSARPALRMTCSRCSTRWHARANTATTPAWPPLTPQRARRRGRWRSARLNSVTPPWRAQQPVFCHRAHGSQRGYADAERRLGERISSESFPSSALMAASSVGDRSPDPDGYAETLTRWERDWERTLLAAGRWCSAVLAPTRF